MKIGISMGRTINTGNYESARIDVTMEQDIDDDIQLRESAWSDLRTECKNRLADEVKRIDSNPKWPMEEKDGNTSKRK
jgi:hypothetical protein